MSLKEIIYNNIQLILGVLLTLFSSLITLIVKDFLDKKKVREDRTAQLNKEIYFNLQKRAEEIFLGVERYRQIINKNKLILEYKPINIKEFNAEDILKHFGEYKEKLAMNISLYFPKIEEEYENYVNSIRKFYDKFCWCLENIIIKNIACEEAEELKRLLDDLSNKDNIFINKLIKELRDFELKIK